MIRLLSFYGRLNRAQYWLRMVPLFVGLLALYGIVLAAKGNRSDFALLIAAIAVVFMIVVTVAIYATLVKRLHDCGRTGWWSPLLMVPLLGLVFLVAIGLLGGNAGSNSYGQEPTQG